MMKIRHFKESGLIRCNFWAGKGNVELTPIGELLLTEEEFDDFKKMLSTNDQFVFLDEDEGDNGR